MRRFEIIGWTLRAGCRTLRTCPGCCRRAAIIGAADHLPGIATPPTAWRPSGAGCGVSSAGEIIGGRCLVCEIIGGGCIVGDIGDQVAGLTVQQATERIK